MLNFGVSETNGMIKRPQTPVLYVDANPFIYVIEGDDAIALPVKKLLSVLRKRPGIATTSELTLAEVLPKAPSPRHQRQYLDLIIWSNIFDLRPVTRSVLLETARYRRFIAAGRHGKKRPMPKLPDACHIVTAIEANCRIFLSADDELRTPVQLKVLKPNDAGISKLIQELV
jgi:predicted nucleic acid-binding protein